MRIAGDPETTPSVGRKMHALLIIAVIAFVFIAYSNALGNDFVWDDKFLVRSNLYIRSFTHLADIFRTHLASSSGDKNNFYRPVQELSYMIDYSIWGRNPLGYHLTNIMLHAFCAAALYVLCFLIVKSASAAFITAALFGIHPINTEAVTYVAGRADSLYLLFLLLSFILFLKSTQEREAGADTPKNALYILSILSFVVSILSKEIAIIFPLMLCLYLLTFRRPGAKGRPYIYLAPFAAIALLYAIARKTIIDFSGISQSFFMAEFPFYIRILTTFKAICVYLGLIIVPFNLHMEREIAVARPLAEPYSFLAALVVATLIIIVIWLNQRSRRLFFAGAWFFIALIPVSNIVPINSFIAEHWVYMPAIGVYMIAGVLIGRYFFDGDADKTAPPARRVAGAIIVAALFAFYSILTMARNRDWKDEITFFQNALKYSPNKARLHLNFGNTYHERDKKKEALQEYEKAIELKPQFAEPYNNIAGVYMELRRYDEAKNYAMKALAIKPQLHQSLNILGILSEMEGNIPKAEECYLKAINATPDYIDCRMSLAALYMNYGKREKAIQQWKEVLRIDPNHKEARQLINRFSK